MGQFQRHVVGDGINHLGGRRGGVGRGFSSPGDPCRKKRLQKVCALRSNFFFHLIIVAQARGIKMPMPSKNNKRPWALFLIIVAQGHYS